MVCRIFYFSGNLTPKEDKRAKLAQSEVVRIRGRDVKG
jgi:hypothetical protein